ncbi:hypothetical protein ACP70R_017751 [Stipagrostis hirtigluma subsp. patula]
MLDMATCAMAFRLLRMHGYGTSSDELAEFSEESSFHDSVQGHLNDTKTLLELYKASQVQVLEEEFILESIGSWSGKLLKQQLCSNKISRSVNPAESGMLTVKLGSAQSVSRSRWQEAVRTTMTEAEWRWEHYVPSMEEYMRAAEVSFLLGPIVPASAYFVGPELPEEVIRCPEYGELFRHVNTFGRLLNDMRTYEKERRQGKLNSVMLHALSYGGGGSTGAVEAAKQQLSRAMEASRKELLRLVVTEPSAVPRPCKELFWNMCRVMQLFYREKDGYFSPEDMMGSVNAVLHEPLQVRA